MTLHPLDYEKLYRCSDVLATRPFHAGIEADFDYSCALSRGEVKPTQPLEARYTSGTKTPSLAIYTGFSLLLHDSIIDNFISEQITGWETFRINLFGKYDEIIPDYSGISIVGRCNPIDYFRSDVVYHDFPGGSFPHFKGAYFQDNEWDGSDLFMENPDRYGTTLNKYLSHRVKSIFDEHKVKNLMLTKLTESELDVSILKSTKPERVPMHLR